MHHRLGIARLSLSAVLRRETPPATVRPTPQPLPQPPRPARIQAASHQPCQRRRGLPAVCAYHRRISPMAEDGEAGEVDGGEEAGEAAGEGNGNGTAAGPAAADRWREVIDKASHFQLSLGLKLPSQLFSSPDPE